MHAGRNIESMRKLWIWIPPQIRICGFGNQVSPKPSMRIPKSISAFKFNNQIRNEVYDLLLVFMSRCSDYDRRYAKTNLHNSAWEIRSSPNTSCELPGRSRSFAWGIEFKMKFAISRCCSCSMFEFQQSIFQAKRLGSSSWRSSLRCNVVGDKYLGEQAGISLRFSASTFLDSEFWLEGVGERREVGRGWGRGGEGGRGEGGIGARATRKMTGARKGPFEMVTYLVVTGGGVN